VRILYTNPFLPFPPVDGGRLVSFQTIRGLSARDHELTMVLPLRRNEDAKHLGAVEELGTVHAVEAPRSPNALIALTALAHGRSLRIQRHRLPAVMREFERALERPVDLVFLDTLFTSYLVPSVRRLRPGVPIVMLAHNVESLVYERLARESRSAWRWLGLWELERIRNAERRAVLDVERVLTLSDEDARALRALAPSATAETVGAGVPTFAGEEIPAAPAQPRVLFLASYAWPPNREAATWLVEEIWPLVRARVPNATLALAGNDPRNFLRSCARPELGISAVGFVESAAQAVRDASVVTAPLRSGSGIRVKILEALANARPVVTTTLGVEGLPLSDGTHVLVRDTAESFAEGIVSLLGDPERARRLASNGRALVEQLYSWSAAADRMNTALALTVREK